jgi:hypothetical protein
MTALADVQRALNLIRQITSEERAAVRLEALRLMASAIADEAQNIESSTLPKQQSRRRVRPAPVPLPKRPNAPKLPQVAPKALAVPPPQRPKPVKPIQPVKPIAPK